METFTMKRPRFPWKLWSRKRMATEVGYLEANSEFVVAPEEAQAQDAQDALRKTMRSFTLEEIEFALVKEKIAQDAQDALQKAQDAEDVKDARRKTMLSFTLEEIKAALVVKAEDTVPLLGD